MDTKQKFVNIFMSTDRSEWDNLCADFADTITQQAVEFSEDMISADMSVSVLKDAKRNGLEYEAFLAALREFYHACQIYSPVMLSYANPMEGNLTVLDVISLRLLRSFSELYDYEFENDLMTLFLGIHDILSPTDNPMLLPRRINSVLVEFYNNNAEEKIPENHEILNFFEAPPILHLVADVMGLWNNLHDLSKIAIRPLGQR